MADVAIIGGGPAGLASALSLAMKKIPVLIFEPHALPIDKPCGEGIMPAGVAQLKKLGAFAYIDRRLATFFNGVSFISDEGYRAHAIFKNSTGLGCRRLALSSALYQRCLDFPSITFCREKINGIEIDDRGVKLRSETSIHKARMIIGADGLRSRVRAWTSLAGEKALVQRYGLRQHYALKPWSDYVEVYFRRGIEAYITPNGDEQVNVTFLWSKDLLPEFFGATSFAKLLEFFPELEKKLRHKIAVSEESAIGPLLQKTKSVISDGVALVGDASGYYDAITGEGISISLTQANALADVISVALKNSSRGVIKEAQLENYARQHRAISRSYYRNTALLLWLARRPRLMSTIIRLGQSGPKTFSWMIEASRTAT